MAIGNGELLHECSPKHSRMGTERMKQEKETEIEGKKRGVFVWKKIQRARKKLRRPNYSSGLQYPWDCYSPKQWMNSLANLTYTYNPSTTLWGDEKSNAP